MHARHSEPAAEGFALRLRHATSAIHGRAEKTAFIRGFLRGTATRPAYTCLLGALHGVYQTLESQILQLAPSQPALARFDFPPLRRTAALERDLQHLAGDQWATQVPPLAASRAYVARILWAAQSDPVRLIGHLYTRSMGDLAGGQMLARIAERSLGLSPGAGLDFYHFDQIDDIDAMKTLFRSRLNELGSQPAAVTDAIVDEAKRAFRYNIAIFEQLEGSALLSVLRNLPLPWVRAAKTGPAPATGMPATRPAAAHH